MFAATGITDGDMRQGVRFKGESVSTHTFVMRSFKDPLTREQRSFALRIALWRNETPPGSSDYPLKGAGNTLSDTLRDHFLPVIQNYLTGFVNYKKITYGQ